jgi:hypothetical protein
VFVFFLFCIFESLIEQVISYLFSFSYHHFECALFDLFFSLYFFVSNIDLFHFI